MQETVIDALQLSWNVGDDVVEAFCEGALRGAMPHGSPAVPEPPPRCDDGGQLATFPVEWYLMVAGVSVGHGLERVLGDTRDEVERGAQGVMGLASTSLIELLKVNSSTRLSILLGYDYHASTPFRGLPGGNSFYDALGDVVVELTSNLVIEVVGDCGGDVYSVRACAWLEVDVVGRPMHLRKRITFCGEYCAPKMLQEPFLQALHIFLHQLEGRGSRAGGRLWCVWCCDGAYLCRGPRKAVWH